MGRHDEAHDQMTKHKETTKRRQSEEYRRKEENRGEKRKEEDRGEEEEGGGGQKRGTYVPHVSIPGCGGEIRKIAPGVPLTER